MFLELLAEEVLMSSDLLDNTTPGPWIARGCELVGDSTLIATLHWHSGRGAENEADARLIAKAPELAARVKVLEALVERAQLIIPQFQKNWHWAAKSTLTPNQEEG